MKVGMTGLAAPRVVGVDHPARGGALAVTVGALARRASVGELMLPHQREIKAGQRVLKATAQPRLQLRDAPQIRLATAMLAMAASTGLPPHLRLRVQPAPRLLLVADRSVAGQALAVRRLALAGVTALAGDVVVRAMQRRPRRTVVSC